MAETHLSTPGLPAHDGSGVVEGHAGTGEESIAMGMQRYTPYAVECGTGIGLVFQGMRPSSTGDYVLYTDAIERERVLREALNRAAELLSATADFIRINPVKEYDVHYDEADCDGSCLRDDCEIALKQARVALAQ